jgi:peptidoglycan hydrolase-like protein with peptidoglycan-binding domain
VRRLLAAAVAAVAVLAPPSAGAATGGINPQIAGLQVALRAWGLYNGPVDGISGPLTAAGLHAFQRTHGLPTGVADARTRARLGPLGHPLFGSRQLRRGDFGWDVSVLQFVLQRDGIYRGALDGYLDKSTEVALRRYQRRARLAVDGVAGPRTLASIAYRARVPVRARPAPAAGPARRMVYVVRNGDSLTSIAHRFHTTVAALARANHLDPSHYLIIGTRLRVPAARAAAAAASPSEVRGLLDAWSARLGVDRSLVRALAWMESGYQPHVVSDAGARGVLQLLPSTRTYVETTLLGRRIPRTVSGDVEAGVLLLRHLIETFNGDQSLALAAWYQGERAVRTVGVYKVTKPFVADVLALRAHM